MLPGAGPVTIHLPRATLIVTALNERDLRIRIGRNGQFPNDHLHEYVIVKPDKQWPGARLTVAKQRDWWVLRTKLATLSVRAPSGEIYLSEGGRQLLTGYRPDLDSPAPHASWDLRPDEHIYGFGDKRLAIDKRGQLADLWNWDGYASKNNTTYKNVPFFMSSKGYGIYLHNWNRAHFDVGYSDRQRIDMRLEGGEEDLYVFGSPSMKQILGDYTMLTGRPQLLPRWAFGYHQGKASYHGHEAEAVAQRFREDKLPCDAIYYDDVEPAEYEKPFVDKLWNRYRMRLTIGLGMPMAYTGTPYYAGLEKRGFLMVDAAHKPYHYMTQEVEHEIGDPDFFNPKACDYVFDTVWRPALANGEQCGMVDFGELSYVPDPKTKFWPSNGMDVYSTHNLYSLVYTEQLINRAAAFTGKRSFALTRSGFAGSQRFSLTWTGDSMPAYEDLRAHLRGDLSLAMSGFACVGVDIGGWDHKTTDDELYLRWFQAGMWLPWAWSHGQGDHEPYSHGKRVEDLCRKALETRYRLIPYLYNLDEEATRTGVPMLRSLALETNMEPGTENVSDEFFLGPSILVAPIVYPSPRRTVFLPKGRWYDFYGAKKYQGPTRIVVTAPEDHIPVFVRAGSTLPEAPPMQYTSEKPLNPLTLEYFPSTGPGEFRLYEDDGESLNYRWGNFNRTHYRVAMKAGRPVAKVLSMEGTYQRPRRTTRVKAR